MKKNEKTIGEKVKFATQALNVKAEETVEVSADKLQEEIDKKTAELQRCLAVLEQKKELSAHRDTFLYALDNLQAAESKLFEDEGFETRLYKLKFEEASSYNHNDIFSISNRDVLLEFVGFIRAKIEAKIREIEIQLIA